MSSVQLIGRKLAIGLACVIVLLLCRQAVGTGGSDLSGALRHTHTEQTIGIPLLPVVFFDSASSDIPERYDLEPLAGGTTSGSYRTLHDAYLRVLDALAEQLTRSNDNVVLHGYEECSEDLGDCYLARARAKRIKNYLVYDRGIDARRITVRHTRTSCESSMIKMKGASPPSCEHRRVEILTPELRPLTITLRAPTSQSFTSAFIGVRLVLFEPRSECIRSSQQSLLIQYLEQLPTGSDRHVTGYTDVVGHSESGTALGAQRALGVVTLINQLRPDCRIRQLNMNPSRLPPLGLPALDLPEIRYLSRSVVIQLKPWRGTL